MIDPTRQGMRQLLAALLFLAAIRPLSAEEHPTLVLTNGSSRITIALPDAQAGYYRGPRFDWGGMVVQANWRGADFFTELKRPHDPRQHDHAAGACEEFSMESVQGYDAAPVGGPFVKIGVGILTRDTEKEYFFAHPYPIATPGTWTVKRDGDAVRFTQELAAAGVSYAYEKTVRVLPDGFSIARVLTNRGTTALVTDHYGHHMIARDNAPIDGTWTLRFAWPVTAANPAPSFTCADALVSLTGPLEGTLWTRFAWERAPATTAFTIAHGASATALTVANDAPPAEFRLYGEKTAICPEPFTHLDIKPGARAAWTTTYAFAAATQPRAAAAAASSP